MHLSGAEGGTAAVANIAALAELGVGVNPGVCESRLVQVDTPCMPTSS